jgi:hypothetical protein
MSTATLGFVLLTLVATATAGRSLSNAIPIVQAPRGPAPVLLGTAEDWTILAKAGVSTVPPSVVTGDIGVSPVAQGGLTGFSLTLDESREFATSTQAGALYAADFAVPTPSKLTTAISNMQTATVDAAGRTPPDFVNLHIGNLGNQTLAPGLYKFSTSVGFNADAVLDGTAEDTWIFQVAGQLSIDQGVRIHLTGGALAKNIVWVVASTCTFAADSHFKGIILGSTTATFRAESSMEGRVLVQTAVTLDQATITPPSE